MNLFWVLTSEAFRDAVRRRIVPVIVVLALLSLLAVDSCTSCVGSIDSDSGISPSQAKDAPVYLTAIQSGPK